MKKLSLVIAIAAIAAPLLATQPSSAHAEWQIAGFQYFAIEAGAEPTTGYLSNPGGPVVLTPGHANDGIGTITNRDPVPHTFSHCTADCDKAVATSGEGALFHADIASGQSNTTLADTFEQLPAGTYVIMCRVHRWMRAKVILNR